jgi:hypothetical protein
LVETIPKGIKRTAQIDKGHLCLRKENHSFNNKYITYITNTCFVSI